jgi:hypothetical protein
MRGLNLIAAFCVFSVALVAADSPFLGTWKLNVAKSKGTPGTMSKEEKVVFESDGNGIRRTVTGVDGDGKKIDMSDTIPWDGMEHKVGGRTGDPPAMVAGDTRNDHRRRINRSSPVFDVEVVRCFAALA